MQRLVVRGAVPPTMFIVSLQEVARRTPSVGTAVALQPGELSPLTEVKSSVPGKETTAFTQVPFAVYRIAASITVIKCLVPVRNRKSRQQVTLREVYRNGGLRNVQKQLCRRRRDDRRAGVHLRSICSVLLFLRFHRTQARSNVNATVSP